jgi:predicted MPP superfamily phosphohydrolase
MFWKNAKRFMIFWSFVLLAAYLVYIYPLHRLTTWLGYPTVLNVPAIVGLSFAVVAILRLSFRSSSRALEVTLYNWMGIGFVFFTPCLLYEVLRLGLPLNDRWAALLILAIGISVVIFAFANAQRLHCKELRFGHPRFTRNTRLVQISDVHIGSRSAGFLERVVKTINDKNPDFVLITGDFLDAKRVGPRDIAALKTLKAPIYFSIGNHERYAGLEWVIPMLEDAGCVLLRTEAVSFEELQLIGIDDAEDQHQVKNELAKIYLKPECFKVLMYHRPLGWEAAVDSGIDLMLCGHTHNGQIFPFNWLVRQQFQKVRGLHIRDNCHLYVSPGTGTWGPAMRLGSRNEITCIDLHC